MAFFSKSHRDWEIVKGFFHRKYQLEQREEIMLILKYHKHALKELHWKSVSSSSIVGHLPQIISHGVFPSLLFPVSQGQRTYSIEEGEYTETVELKLLCRAVTAYSNLLWVWMLCFLAKPLESRCFHILHQQMQMFSFPQNIFPFFIRKRQVC